MKNSVTIPRWFINGNVMDHAELKGTTEEQESITQSRIIDHCHAALLEPYNQLMLVHGNTIALECAAPQVTIISQIPLIKNTRCYRKLRST